MKASLPILSPSQMVRSTSTLPRRLFPCIFFFLAYVAFLYPQHVKAQATVFSFTWNSTLYQYNGYPAGGTSYSPYGQYVIDHPNSGLVVAEAANPNYNCHAFAWPNSKSCWVTTYGGLNEAPQIYYLNSHKYVTTTNESEAEIVVYGSASNPIHSAVRITNSSNGYGASTRVSYPQYAGWYVSKWDSGPLVIHRLTDCPYYAATSIAPTFLRKADEPASNNKISGANYTITGSKLVCASGTQFTLSCGTPKSFTVTWSASSNITLPANPTTYPLTATANGSGTGYIQATLNFPDGTSSSTATFPVWVGVPEAITSVSSSQWTAGPMFGSLNVNQSYATLYAWPFNGGDVLTPNPIDSHGSNHYTWTVAPGLTFYQNSATLGNRYAQGAFSAPGYGSLTVEASNACGSTLRWQSIIVGSSSFSMAPNPAVSEAVITISADNLVEASPNTAAKYAKGVTAPPKIATGAQVNYNIRVIDASGVVRYTLKKSGSRFTIPVNDLPNGIYVIEISDGKVATTKSLLVAH